jgi:hypothetical protein
MHITLNFVTGSDPTSTRAYHPSSHSMLIDGLHSVVVRTATSTALAGSAVNHRRE